MPRCVGLLAAVSAMILILSAGSNPYDPGQRALGGAGIGAGAGALIGGLAGGWHGAVTGAVTTPRPAQAAYHAPPPPPTY
jgi:hypothetical protein